MPRVINPCIFQRMDAQMGFPVHMPTLTFSPQMLPPSDTVEPPLPYPKCYACNGQVSNGWPTGSLVVLLVDGAPLLHLALQHLLREPDFMRYDAHTRGHKCKQMCAWVTYDIARCQTADKACRSLCPVRGRSTPSTTENRGRVYHERTWGGGAVSLGDAAAHSCTPHKHSTAHPQPTYLSSSSVKNCCPLVSCTVIPVHPLLGSGACS